ncbi:hypothetical protein P6U16_17810 [Rhizobium sp. 32-5/1]|uniref:hypothetical protein n=1 Tax=Rhizobium sp. 32-5/1 TaxID=3019602 RepID=UPI00240E4FCB|nr:hypothetical protein [Rhizobium sp. 32-5/1]WEZ82829.1 hypothetical protein P6U16_17810 [Rhizobium sp. 32-5/1]
MSDERPDQYMMIGLHKMASQFGDGLVPELYELLMRRSRLTEESLNVVAFPASQARPPVYGTFALAPLVQDNIVSFPDAREKRAALTHKR